MIGWIQRAVVAAIAAVLIAMVAWVANGGSRTVAVLVCALALFGHAIVLAGEMLAMRAINRRFGDPVPRWRDLLAAWLHECALAPLVFCWRQPFGRSRWPDALPPAAERRRGLLLVHGYACNRGLWQGWMRRLAVFGVPCVAVDLEPPWAGIDSHAGTIGAAVAALRTATGQAPVIVAHSMGGLAVRAWLASAGNAECVHHLVTLASPHHGTVMARFGVGRNVRQMRPGSPWLAGLAAAWTPALAERTTCWVAGCDNVVFPQRTAVLPGAQVRRVEACAHVELVERPEPFEAVLRQLR